MGRRSGRPHAVIFGYCEDGPNLVTLAMNGWAGADPAWWLNLHAHPETTVDLAHGTVAVTARPATGHERHRLRTSAGEFPGWATTSRHTQPDDRRRRP